MMDEIPSVRPPAPAPRRWRPSAPHPVVYPVWVLTAALFWYAPPLGPQAPHPGDPLSVYYPMVVEYGKALLAAYWGGASIIIGIGLWRHPRLDTRRWVTTVLAALIACAAVAYGAARFVPGPVQDTAWSVGPLCGFVAVLLAAGLTSSRRPRFALVSLGLSLIAALPLAVLSSDFLWGEWRDVAQVAARDGRRYHVLHQQIWIAGGDVLALEVSRGPLFLRTTVVADAGETTSSYPTLVRPQSGRTYGPLSMNGALLNSRDGEWLLYVIAPHPGGGYKVRFAYNLRAHRLYRGADRVAISPFLLVGPHDALDPEDVASARLAGLAGPTSYGNEGMPALRPALARDRTSPNPEVRRLVAELLAKPPAGAKPQGGEGAAGRDSTP